MVHFYFQIVLIFKCTHARPGPPSVTLSMSIPVSTDKWPSTEKIVHPAKILVIVSVRLMMRASLKWLNCFKKINFVRIPFF